MLTTICSYSIVGGDFIPITFENELAYKTAYDGYYATMSGKIISVKKKGGQGSIDLSAPREHSYKIDKDGYLECCISVIENGKHKRLYRRVHRVVYETFYGPISDELTVDHIDKNTKNNSISNLRLLTREENTRTALKGKKSPKRFLYKLLFNGQPLGIFDRLELKERIGLGLKDYYRDTSNVKRLRKLGYEWIVVSVEDIEKVS